MIYRYFPKTKFGYSYRGERNHRTVALLRLLVVSVVILSHFLIHRHQNRELLIVLASALLLSALIYYNKPISRWLADHKYIELLIDQAFIFAACFYTGGLDSPYILALFLPLMAHSISPISIKLLVVALVTIGNLVIIGLVNTMNWQLVAYLASCLLLTAVFINILVFNGIRVFPTYAVYDGLTGLYTHQYFWDQLHSMLKPSNDFKTFSLIMIDLDEFKKINDEHGHLEGDRVLREIAETIKASVRDSDIVARYGGDEFAIILPGISYQTCRSVIERLSASIVDLGYFDHVSIGSAYYPDEAQTAEELVNLADSRMYLQKRHNKN